MIVKNPYTYIAKYYRLINFILLIPTIYLMFVFSDLATFFKDYVVSGYTTIETNMSETYITTLSFVVPILMIVFHFAIWLILTLRKKKTYYHIIAAGYFLFSLLALVFFYTSLLNIEMMNMEQTMANFLKDISVICVYPFYALIVMGLTNVVGFNVKSLRFDKHADLKVTVEDEEDIEVKVGTDHHNTKRRVVHLLRELKYYVIENKGIMILIVIGLCIMFGYKAYLNYEVYNKNYDINQSFALDSFALSVKESYITNVDYRGRVITNGKYYLAVKIGIHNQGNATKIDKSIFRIYVGNQVIYPSYDKGSRFVDVGVPYKGETVLNDVANDYVFVYELTDKQLKGTYEMRILNGLRSENVELKANYKKIKIRPEYIIDTINKSPKKLGNKVALSDSTLEKTTYRLNSLKIYPDYKYEQEICRTQKDCNKIQDIIVPSGGKVLMVLEDEIIYDESTPYFLYKEKNFYEDFVTVVYTFDIASGKNSGPVTQVGTIKDVTPKSLKGKKVFEVPGNLITAYKVDLKINVRNQVYTIKAVEK